MRVDRMLLAIAIATALIGAILAIDLIWAIQSQPCPAPDCYPWDAEGPVAGRWSYQSKANYLASGVALFALPVAAALLLAVRRDRAAVSHGKRTASILLLGITACLYWFG